MTRTIPTAARGAEPAVSAGWKTSPIYAVWEIDGTLLSVSESYAQLVGSTLAEVVGQRWPDLVPDEVEFCWQQLHFSVETLRTAPVLVVDLPTHAQGVTRWLRWTEWAVRDEHGELVQVRSTAVDVSELHEARVALAATIDAVVAARVAGRQEVAEQLHNGAVQQLTAARWALSDGDLHGAMSLVDSALRAVRSSVDALDPPAVSLPLVSSVDMEVSWVPNPLTVDRDDLSPVGLNDAMEATVADTGVVFTPTGMVWASERARSLFGDPGTTMDLADVLARVHPDDRPSVAATLTAVLSGEPRQLLWRFRHPILGTRCLATRFRPLPRAKGDVPMAAAISVDVTEGTSRLMGTERADERNQLARALHDDALQQLAGLRWMLVERGLDAEVMAELDVVDAAVRHQTERLSSTVAHVGLRTAIEQLVDATATPVEFAWLGDLDAVPAEPAERLWRSAREALRNVDRHAQATKATVQVEVSRTAVTLTVADDGVGVTPTVLVSARKAGHLGVAAMRESVTSAGGRFEMGSPPGGGTRVSAELPLGPA